ncbi:cytochrome c-type biogenesis protein CcmH [Endozoicomonas montiporae CL-33]|nr:cytochrome c-type biogenesis protein CcmH [Endozoicomonas montiporae CL-33]
MFELWLMIFILALAGMGFALYPMLGRIKPVSDVSSKESNVAYFREQEAELQAQVEQGLLTETTAEQMRSELEKKLLNDVSGSGQRAGLELGNSKAIALFLAVLMPLTAVPLYMKLGATPELKISQLIQQSGVPSGELVEALEQWREKRPYNSQALYMLGSRYLSAGDTDRAVDAFQQLYLATGGAPQASAELAQSLYVAADYQMTDEVRRYYRETLHNDDNNAIALGLNGIDAFANGDYNEAIRVWNRALGVEADVGVRQSIMDGISEARARLGMPSPEVRINLSLAPELGEELGELPADTRVFIFARESDGSSHPVAVIPMNVADLPGEFVLDDNATRMMGGTSLAGISHLDIIARISLSGDVSQGDYQADARAVDVSSGETLELVLQPLG